jgi:multiple sugar transport system substrate-binding protein
LNLIKSGKGLPTPEDLIASGSFPDIIFAANPVFPTLKELHVLSDLSPLIKQNHVDLSKFDPTTIEAIKLYGTSGEMIALPFARNYGGLFYNKDLFDKVGVPYPKDGMTWDSTAELGRKVARVDNGVIYRGFEPTGLREFVQAMSLVFFNPKTQKATMTGDNWTKALKKIQDIYNIPNNLPPTDEFLKLRANFVERKDVAMIPDWVNGISGELEKSYKEGQGLNWDVVSQPNFKEFAGIGRNVDIQSLLLSSSTKHKNEAFAVMDLLTSKEAQVSITRAGRLAAMNDPDIQKQYAADLGSFKGKNVAGIFKVKSAKLNPPSDYDQIIFKSFGEANRRAVLNKEDANTVLRETEEKVNKQIAEAQAAKK